MLCSVSDRTVQIWSCASLEETKNRKCFRIKIDFDYATKLAWSPDDKAIAIQKSFENCIEIYKLERKNGWFTGSSKISTFPKVSDSDIIAIDIACTGRFMMTCTNKTDIYILDLKGNILEKIDTYLMNTYSAKISNCGRFIAACGFAPDCKIWEVKFSKNGEYQKTIRAFDLSGHTSAIYDMAFDQDASHMITVSKDGTWKFYNTNIEYEKGQSPRCLKTGKYTCRGMTPIIAFSLNAEVLAISVGSGIEIYSTLTTECDMIIKHIFDGYIVALTFDALGKYCFTAGDKLIRVFHNATGYRTAIATAKAKLKTNISTTTVERLEKLIEENEAFLKKIS